MLESELADHFERNEWTWKLDNKDIVPREEDFLEALDKAAERLYDSPDGTQMEVGRLIIQKQGDRFYVYALFGTYS